MAYTCDAGRMQEKINTFARFGETGNGGITRLSLSEPALQARQEFVRRMQALGASVVSDDLANLYATIPGSEDLPAIFSGSHLDSVRQGGNYDGVLGVLSAMEAAETIVRQNIPHRHPLTVVVWTNEEGARYEPAMMCSGILCGKFDEAAMLAVEANDLPGYTFGQALAESGWQGSRDNRLQPANCAALVELHAEQGPVLEAAGCEIGVVEGVVGMLNETIVFRGQADHAGTTPMAFRRDALYAAAQAIVWLHEQLDKLDPALVYTTGKITAHPNIHTIIPDEVCLTIEARHRDMAVIHQVEQVLQALPKEIAGCSVQRRRGWDRETVQFAATLVQTVEVSARELGYSYRRMYSGAGHDAQYLSELVPTTMIFVPSQAGHSHCELEHTPLDACVKGANVLLHTLLQLDQTL